MGLKVGLKRKGGGGRSKSGDLILSHDASLYVVDSVIDHLIYNYTCYALNSGGKRDRAYRTNTLNMTVGAAIISLSKFEILDTSKPI